MMTSYPRSRCRQLMRDRHLCPSVFIRGSNALVCEPEVDLGSLPRDDIRKRPAAPAGERPAERAVAGVEEEVRIARAADQRNVRGRRGAQPGPEARVL